MTNVSHHCPPTTAAITWPGSRTYVVYAPAMTFAPSQLSWLHCVLLSFKKKKTKNEKAQDTYPENAPPGRVRKSRSGKGKTSASSCPAGCHDFMAHAHGLLGPETPDSRIWDSRNPSQLRD